MYHLDIHFGLFRIQCLERWPIPMLAVQVNHLWRTKVDHYDTANTDDANAVYVGYATGLLVGCFCKILTDTHLPHRYRLDICQIRRRLHRLWRQNHHQAVCYVVLHTSNKYDGNSDWSNVKIVLHCCTNLAFIGVILGNGLCRVRYLLIASGCLFLDAIVLELPLQYCGQEEFHGLVWIQILYLVVCASVLIHLWWQSNILFNCRALGSMAMFPILQWVFRNDVNKREGIPQLAYGIEGTVHTHTRTKRSSSTVPMWIYLINKLVALITSLLGVRSHFRFKRIIALSHRNNGASNKAIVTRLAYFKDMNVLISIILFFYAASFIVLCSDGLTDHKIINTNKFATDTIIANVNICTVFLWLLLVR